MPVPFPSSPRYEEIPVVTFHDDEVRGTGGVEKKKMTGGRAAATIFPPFGPEDAFVEMSSPTLREIRKYQKSSELHIKRCRGPL